MSTVPGTGTPLTLPQQREAMWADARLQVHAVVMGSRVPDLRARLDADGLREWDRLWTGELSDEEQAASPVLVSLRREAAFSDWLTDAAATDFGPWGLLLQSERPYLALRAHARSLCQAVLPDGQELRLDWMDGQILRALLQAAPPQQLQALFAPLHGLVEVSPQGWTHWSLAVGQLQTRHHPLLAAAA